MPRFRAAVLDRAAAAGAPRLRSDFHGVSEWHSYQDSWLKVFWPDETLAVDNLVERQTTWAAATRQHTKAETQRLADALRAAGSATGNAAGMAAVGSSSTAACDGGPLPLAHGELSGLAAGMGSKHYEEGSAAGPSAHSGVQHGSAGSLRASDTTMVVSGSDRVLGYSVTQHSSADILDTLHELRSAEPFFRIPCSLGRSDLPSSVLFSVAAAAIDSRGLPTFIHAGLCCSCSTNAEASR